MGIYRLIVKFRCNNKEYIIPPSFEECYFGSNPLQMIVVMNPYDERSCSLPTFAVSIYHQILDTNMTEDEDLREEGMMWFEKNFNEEYFILLD